MANSEMSDQRPGHFGHACPSLAGAWRRTAFSPYCETDPLAPCLAMAPWLARRAGEQVSMGSRGSLADRSVSTAALPWVAAQRVGHGGGHRGAIAWRRSTWSSLAMARRRCGRGSLTVCRMAAHGVQLVGLIRPDCAVLGHGTQVELGHGTQVEVGHGAQPLAVRMSACGGRMAPHPPCITRGVIYPGPLAGLKTRKNREWRDLGE